MQVSVTKYFDVNLSEAESKRITIESLRKLADVKDGYYIEENGDLMYEYECHTSHSWFDKDNLGKPTELQKAVLLIIDELNKG